MGYGSEFRPIISHLEPLLLHHRNWPSLSLQLEKGSIWPLKTLSESDCFQKNMNLFHVETTNLPSHTMTFSKASFKKKEQQGWMVPLLLKFINDIPGSEHALIGIDGKRFKCLPNGTEIPKYRMTHDQSFEASVGASVNS
jgi:hypothetical protein